MAAFIPSKVAVTASATFGSSPSRTFITFSRRALSMKSSGSEATREAILEPSGAVKQLPSGLCEGGGAADGTA